MSVVDYYSHVQDNSLARVVEEVGRDGNRNYNPRKEQYKDLEKKFAQNEPHIKEIIKLTAEIRVNILNSFEIKTKYDQ
uniref:Uncharacterized protein n=1 Tax=Panagrolaimus superbus TaxID=310955 RepID=A0A914YC72_9BILA